jgi:mono/diheme cytochrome c family protein
MRVVQVFALLLAALLVAAGSGTRSPLTLQPARSSPQDLEISGDLAGLPEGTVRFVKYEDLLTFPQGTFTPAGDANFPTGGALSGMRLEELIHALGLPDSGQLIAAECNDKYEAHYTAAYRAAHDPILVLRIGGKPPTSWPTIEGNSSGPYLISHASFTPAFHVLSHADEAQIPFGVVGLKFFKEDAVLAVLRPKGEYAPDSAVMQGYQIAFQNCFRCHNQGVFGGRKAGVAWNTLARYATWDPAGFAAVVHDPKSKNPAAKMPGNPEYDADTLHALTAYFQAFNQQAKR